MKSALEQEQFFRQVLFKAFGNEVELIEYQVIYGGSINLAVRLDCAKGSFFLKFNSAAPPLFFNAEAENLNYIASKSSVITPEIISLGKIDDYDYLLLSYEKPGFRGNGFWENFGRHLADLHRVKSPLCGFDTDNFIGLLNQRNHPREKDWISFFTTNRLNTLASLAYYEGKISKEELKQIQRIYPKLDSLLPKEDPSLIHGDLWSENFLCNEESTPIFIDPACYFGHREVDLAMTHLFGGFDSRFYDSYQEAHPLEPLFEERIDIYNLYPLLVHVNLFGRSYLSPILKTVNKFT